VAGEPVEQNTPLRSGRDHGPLGRTVGKVATTCAPARSPRAAPVGRPSSAHRARWYPGSSTASRAPGDRTRANCASADVLPVVASTTSGSTGSPR